MNTQLIDSLIQVVQSLPEIEQKELVDKLNQLIKKPTSDPSNQEENIDDKAWEVWQSLGDDAIAGKLDNTSINHDQYLYGKKS